MSIGFLFIFFMVITQISCEHPTQHLTKNFENGRNRRDNIATTGGEKVSGLEFEHKKIGDNQNILQARHLLQAGNFENAIAVLQQEVFSSPEQLEAKILLAGALIEKGEQEKSEKSLEATIEKWPESPQAHLLMGYCLIDSPKNEKALIYFKKVLMLTQDPEQRIAAHLGLASIYEKFGDQTNANQHYAQAISIEPKLIDVLIMIQKESLRPQPVFSKKNKLEKSEPDRNRLSNIEIELKNLFPDQYTK